MHFRSEVESKLEEIQQVILDNLWNAQYVVQKVKFSNASTFYFSNLPSKSFPCYVVIQGHRPGMYSTCQNVLEQIYNFQNPLYKGFHNIHETLEFARSKIGIKFFFSDKPQHELGIPTPKFIRKPATQLHQSANSKSLRESMNEKEKENYSFTN